MAQVDFLTIPELMDPSYSLVFTLSPSPVPPGYAVAVTSRGPEGAAGIFVLSLPEAERIHDWLGTILDRRGDPEVPGTIPEHRDESWLAEPWGRCRYIRRSGLRRGWRSCGEPTVASVLRGSRRPSRWGYCAAHLARFLRVVRADGVWWAPDDAAALIREADRA